MSHGGRGEGRRSAGQETGWEQQKQARQVLMRADLLELTQASSSVESHPL
jgi:hypothetical protein